MDLIKKTSCEYPLIDLRIIYRDGASSFDEHLPIDGSVTIHHRNIRTHAIEIYTIHNGTTPAFMREVFPQRNLRNFECVAGNIRSQLDFYNLANPKLTSRRGALVKGLEYITTNLKVARVRVPLVI